jgi:hypothetical protein
MTPAEWGVVVAIVAHAIAVLIAILKLVAWGSSMHARIEARISGVEAKVDNDITGRRIVAELRSDVASIKSTLVDLKEHVRHQIERLDAANRHRDT